MLGPHTSMKTKLVKTDVSEVQITNLYPELRPALYFKIHHSNDRVFPRWLSGKESTCQGLGSIPGTGRSPGERNDNLLQHSCLENPMHRRAWQVSPWGCKESDMTWRLNNRHMVNHNINFLINLTLRKLSTEESMLLNCGVGEDSWESFGLQEDPTGPS